MKRAWCVALAGLAMTSVAQAQTELERFERQLELIQRQSRVRVDPQSPVDERLYINLGGFASFNFLAIDDQNQRTHILRQTDMALYGRVSFDGVHEVFVRGGASYRDFNTGDSFDGKGDEWVDPNLERAYYRFDLNRLMSAYHETSLNWNLVLQGGRQLVHWANGLTLSQVIDGGQIVVTLPNVELVAVAGVTRPETIDIDSARPGFDDQTRRGFYGGMVRLTTWKEFQPYAYGLVQRDNNSREDVLVFGPDTTAFEYHSEYIGLGVHGFVGTRWYYGIEAVLELGESLSSAYDANGAGTAQTMEDIEAFAVSGLVEYLLGDHRNTRLSFETIVASGDRDRGVGSSTFTGNLTGTSDHAFIGFGLVNTGLAFAPNLSNLISVRAGASTFPLPDTRAFRKLQVGADVFVFNKLQQSAPVDETTGSSRFLGMETDLYANWQVLSDVSVGVRYGVFFPGEAIESASGARQFVFMSVTYGF